MRWSLAVLLLWLGYGSALRAQDLTGQWTGGATDNLSDKKQKLVFNIASGDSAFGGVLHWYLPETHFIRHILISGRYYGRDSILTIREDSIISTGMTESGQQAEVHPASPAAGFLVLYYKRIGHKEVLQGRWTDPSAGSAGGNNQRSGSLDIRLEKKAPPFIPLVLPSHKKKDSTQQRQYETMQNRQSLVAATVPVHGTDSIRIALYDNGEIDGDSVSLYLNNELLIQHLRLTDQAKTLIIAIDRSLPVNKLVLFAENMGKLPPNTALMEVTTHGKTYNIFLSTDYKRNATVEFTLQE